MSRPPATVPAELASGPFARRAVLGSVTDRTLAGPAYQSLLRGAHQAAELDVTHEARIRAVRAVMPADAVLGGRSALWVWGVRVASQEEPVEIVLPPTRRVRQRAELRVRGDVLRADEVVESPLGPVTSPARTAFDLGRRGSLRDSVPLLDALAHVTQVSAEEVMPLVRAHRGARHLMRLPEALAEVDGRSESIRESLLRLLVIEAGFPRPDLQYTVLDVARRFVARVDLAWPELRLALEYDGSHHDDPAQIALDRRRLSALHRCGWSVVVIDRHQLRNERRVVETIRRARINAGATH